MKYKVGDKVKIRSDLVVGEDYNGIKVVYSMAKRKGENATILNVYDTIGAYLITGDYESFVWTDGMFEDDLPCTGHDVVNHPSHYCQDDSMECIDEMIALYSVEEVKSFCKLNVHKYRKRALYKNKEEDMKKSDWYMKKYVELSANE